MIISSVSLHPLIGSLVPLCKNISFSFCLSDRAFFFFFFYFKNIFKRKRRWSSYLDKAWHGSHIPPVHPPPPFQLAWEPTVPTKEAEGEKTVTYWSKGGIKITLKRKK